MRMYFAYDTDTLFATKNIDLVKSTTSWTENAHLFNSINLGYDRLAKFNSKVVAAASPSPEMPNPFAVVDAVTVMGLVDAEIATFPADSESLLLDRLKDVNETLAAHPGCFVVVATTAD